jgi:PhzF family phenazine biosynthesis protein
MATAPFAVVDVFSSTAFKGNPLAIVDNTRDVLSTAQLQLLARQFNLSETTFYSPPTVPNATYQLRSFLPDGKEVDIEMRRVKGTLRGLDPTLLRVKGHEASLTRPEGYPRVP